MEEKKNSKAIKIITRILLLIPLVLSALFILVFGGFNIFKFMYYSEYYSLREEVCKNPGLSDGYVPQGIAYVDSEDIILTSGYMNNKKASRIYITDLKNNSRYVELTQNGEEFKGHVGGIASTGNDIYLSTDSKLYKLDLKDVLSNKKVDVKEGIDVNNQASFVYSDDKNIYVGEFHNGGKYVTNHPYDTKEGKHYAIISAYSKDDLSKPLRIYSIRNKVQGFCITDNGDMILSTSYGLSDSYYYIYHQNELTNSNLTFDGAPVYYLENYARKIKGPAMSEDLDIYKGKVLTLTESACEKYIFGKIFFANKINALSL